MILDKVPLISKPSKSLAIFLPLEKTPKKNVRDLPSKNRDETKALASPKAEEEDIVEPRTMLLIKFPRQARLTSTGELKAKCLQTVVYTPAIVKHAMTISPQRTNKEVMILDKIPLISKPNKSLAIVLPLEKTPKKNVSDLPSKNRDETKALASPKAAEEDIVEPRTKLLIKFPRQARLTSTGELKAKFVGFGPLHVSAMYASL